MRGALRSFVHAALKIAHPHADFDPLDHNGLTARCHRDWPADADFVTRWNSLSAQDPSATVFSGPIWQSSVVDEFVPAPDFRLITVERNHQLLAILPLALNSVSMLETPGHWVSDYLEPTIDPNAASEIWDIILRLLDNLWDWSVGGVKLHHIRANSPIRDTLRALAPQHRFEYTETPVAKNPYLDLPKSWDQFLATLDSHERKEIKRKIRNAQTKANLQWNNLTTPTEIQPALERAISAMRNSDPLKANFTERVLGNFLRRLCPKLATAGQLTLQELHLEGNPAAWLFNLPSSRGPMIYNTSYDYAQRQHSPGIVSFALGIQDAITAQAPVYNLLRGDEEYKERLGAQVMDLYTIQLMPA
jgi:CelD/BcsL family acetyltransferase involved in cellulose biosynthesis